MGQPHHRSPQVWHALSMDHTVLPATHAFIHEWNEPYLPLPSQPKLVLIYRPRRDGRLSWPRHTMVNKQSTQDRYVTEITVLSCSDRHDLPGNWKRSRPRAWNSRLLVPYEVTLTHYTTVYGLKSSHAITLLSLCLSILHLTIVLRL